MDLGSLHEEESRRAYAFALRLLGSPSAAEDAVADAFALLVGGRAEVGDRAELMRLVRRVAIDAWRSEKSRRAREEACSMEIVTSTAPDRTLETVELARAARAAMSQLSMEERIAVTLSCEQGLGPGEMARIMEVPVETARSHRRRGLAKLREVLAAGGFASALPAGIESALGASPMEELPASLAARLSSLGGASKSTAAASAAVKGGVLVKIGLGIAAVGLVAGATFWAVGGKSGEPTKPEGQAPPAVAPEKKSKFDTPIWHPEAEWECAERHVGSIAGVRSAWLDGPRQEMLSRDYAHGPWLSANGGQERAVWGLLDEETERYHSVAGAEVYGCLDGPFSRARYGGWGYQDGSFSAMTPDRRYLYTSDRANGTMIRRLDFEKQEIVTVEWAVKSFTGLTIGKDGRIYAVSPPHLMVMDQDGKLERKIQLELKGDVGWTARMAHDPKRNRMWSTSGHNTKRQWHVWYWDLNDGSFHGEVPAKPAQPGDSMFGGLPGSYKDGWFVYPESHVYFGPDDPDYRFLYSGHTDCGNSFRLDLEKKEVWVLIGPPRNKSGPIRYVFKREEVRPFEAHVSPEWLPNGDFLQMIGGSQGLGTYLYRRVK